MTSFRDRAFPEQAHLAGYAWLIERHALEVPTPPRLAAVVGHRRPSVAGTWAMFPEAYEPEPTLAGHATFALKYEGVNLAALFRAVPDEFVACDNPANRQARTATWDVRQATGRSRRNRPLRRRPIDWRLP